MMSNPYEQKAREIAHRYLTLRDENLHCDEPVTPDGHVYVCNALTVAIATALSQAAEAAKEERIAELEIALKPLADAADGYEDHASDDQGCAGLTLKDARHARRLLDGREHNEMPERADG
jgi:hypothetical protein